MEDDQANGQHRESVPAIVARSPAAHDTQRTPSDQIVLREARRAGLCGAHSDDASRAEKDGGMCNGRRRHAPTVEDGL